MAVTVQPSLTDLLERDAADAWLFYDRLANVYGRELRRYARGAVAPLHRAQFTRALTSAGKPADWVIPDPDEILNVTKASGELFAKTRTLREQIAETAVGGTLAAYGLSFNLRNPTIQNVVTQMGTHITRIVEDERAAIMTSLEDSWQKGLSIRDAARQMLTDSSISSRVRADMIARTELNGAVNGGSLAAVRLVNEASPPDTRMTKIWIATNDNRTRDSHSEASDEYGEGNGIPIDQAFTVGGFPLDHPGDPSGPPEEVINCRCTIGYEQAGALGKEPAPPVEPISEPLPEPVVESQAITMSGNWAPNPAVEQEVQQVADRLAAKYKTDFTDVKVDPNRDDLNQLAGRSHTHIYVAPKYLDDKWMANWSREFRGVMVKPDREGVIIHEYGHLAENTMLRVDKAAHDKLWKYVNEDVHYDVGGKTVTSPRWQAGDGSAPSAYASESRYEYMAEAFSDWYVNGEKAKLTSQTIGKMIDDSLAREAAVAPERTAAAMARDLVTSAKREEAQVTNDLQSIVRANHGEMGGLDFRLKTEKSLAGKLERKAREKGITPEEYSKSVADVLRYTGVFEPADYAAGVDRTIERLTKAGYQIDKRDIENYWASGDDYNGINMTLRTPSGYRFELQFHTPESFALKAEDGPLHPIYEKFRDEQNPHERLRLWNQMVDLSNGITLPDESVLKIGYRVVHTAPALPETSEELATSLIESATRRDAAITGDMKAAISEHGGKLEGLDFRVKSHDSLVRKLNAKGPFTPATYSTHVADVLRYTGTFRDDTQYADNVVKAIQELRDRGYRIEVKDVENYWEPGDDYNGINVNVSTADGYRFEVQFHTPESFRLKNGELHRLYSEYRTSTDPFIRKELWYQMVELSDGLPNMILIDSKRAIQHGEVLKIGTLTRHESPVAIGLDEINRATGVLNRDNALRYHTAGYDAVQYYSGSGYDLLNEILRTGTVEGIDSMLPSVRESLFEVAKKQTDVLNSLFVPAEKPFMAYRGFKKAVLDRYSTHADLTDLIGKTIEDPGFASVSASKRVGETFSQQGASGSSRTGPESVVMELIVPKGTPTLNLSRMEGNENYSEQEIILPPGTKFQVVGVRRDVEGRYVVRAVIEP